MLTMATISHMRGGAAGAGAGAGDAAASHYLEIIARCPLCNSRHNNDSITRLQSSLQPPPVVTRVMRSAEQLCPSTRTWAAMSRHRCLHVCRELQRTLSKYFTNTDSEMIITWGIIE